MPLIIAALALVCASAAWATVTGSLTVKNGTSGVIPGTIIYNGCQPNPNVTCTFVTSLTPGSSGTGTVVNSHDDYAGGDYPGIVETPQCTWQVQVTSNGSGNYSGMVHTFAQGDTGYNGGVGYTPTCSYSGFSVDLGHLLLIGHIKKARSEKAFAFEETLNACGKGVMPRYLLLR
jgi:hypothetical protein